MYHWIILRKLRCEIQSSVHVSSPPRDAAGLVVWWATWGGWGEPGIRSREETSGTVFALIVPQRGSCMPSGYPAPSNVLHDVVPDVSSPHVYVLGVCEARILSELPVRIIWQPHVPAAGIFGFPEEEKEEEAEEAANRDKIKKVERRTGKGKEKGWQIRGTMRKTFAFWC